MFNVARLQTPPEMISCEMVANERIKRKHSFSIVEGNNMAPF